jgi:hypothetical protein
MGKTETLKQQREWGKGKKDGACQDKVHKKETPSEAG